MKKRIIGLVIYTLVVLLVAFFFHKHYWFSMSYYLAIGILLMFIVNQIMPGAYMSSGSVASHLEFRSLETVPKEQKFADIDLISLLTLLYLIVPFILSLYLFE